MKFVLILVGVVLLTTVVSADHPVKKSSAVLKHGEKHAEAIDKKKHHLTKSGKKSSFEHEKSHKGKSEVISHKKEDAEKAGKKHHSIDEGHHHVAKHDEAFNAHGDSYKNGDHRKKTGFVQAFREQYHKDEQKKDGSFYSNKHKSGQWLKFGGGRSKHHFAHHDKDSNGKYRAGKHAEKHGKEQKYGHGHQNSDHKGFKNKHEAHSQMAKLEKYERKPH